jgi:hypothetical protein
LPAAALAGPNFRAGLDRNNVPAGQNIKVTFTLENGQGSNFRAPSFEGFSVLMGPSTSQSMQIINGQMSRSVSYSYVIRAKEPGTYTIDPARITVDGRELKSNPLRVKVSKGRSGGGQDGGGQSQQQQAEEIIRDNLFIKLHVNKREVWQGEQIFATYKLYMHPQLKVVNLDFPKMPALNGFWAQDVEEITRLNISHENYNGVRYETAPIKKVMLLPQRSGTLTVDPVSIESVVRLRVRSGRRSIFDDPFFNRNYKDFPYSAQSNSVKVRVKPLPEGAPESFNGAVGNLNMEAWLDKTVTTANEPVSFKIKISGNGNMKLVEPLNIELPPDIESYEPKTADNLQVTSSGFRGNLVFEYLLVPRNPGEFRLGPVEFTYFDLKKEEYITLKSEEFILKVAEGKGDGESGMISGVTKEDIKYIGKDIRFIKTDKSAAEKPGDRFFASFGFAALSIAPFLLFVLFIFKRRRDEKLHGNQALLRNKKANKIARKRLTEARKFMQQSEKEKFHEEINRALWGYASDKLGIPFADLNKDTARDALAKYNVSDELTDRLIETIEHCEYARFAPQQAEGELERIYDRAASVITDMEGRLK